MFDIDSPLSSDGSVHVSYERCASGSGAEVSLDCSNSVRATILKGSVNCDMEIPYLDLKLRILK